MLDSKLLSDGELHQLFSEPLTEQEAEAMRQADETARPLLAFSLSKVPDLIIEE